MRELSDEEIYELWCESDNTELLPEMRNKDGSINYIILTFAELLLDKCSHHEAMAHQGGYELGFEAGRQQGMKQERALWELAQSTQEIERNGIK